MRVGQAIRRIERRKTDPEFRKKRKMMNKEYNDLPINKYKRREYQRNYTLKLSKFRNRKCKKCGKLLNYRTKGEFCSKCRPHKKKKMEEKE